MSLKTHYRKAFDSPYLSSNDLDEPLHLTIKGVQMERHRTDPTKGTFNVASFEQPEIRPGEALKPMIVNLTNCKFLAALSGSKLIEDWAGTKVAVYVDRDVTIDDNVVGGLRFGAPEDHPIAPQSLVKAAEAAAAKGTAQFGTWWRGLLVSERELLDGRLDRLKSTAREADASRASPAAKKTKATAGAR